jgi:hypothetical protein
MDLFSGFDKLINERGSAAILPVKAKVARPNFGACRFSQESAPILWHHH